MSKPILSEAKQSVYFACRAIARNPQAVVQILRPEQINRLAASQQEYEHQRYLFEEAKRKVSSDIERIMAEK